MKDSKSVHQRMIDAGIPCHGHYSDLYVPCTPEAAQILEDAGLLHTAAVTRFVNQVEGGLWYDVAFQYDKNLTPKK